MYGDTRNYVSNGFLPGVVWANLSLPESFDAALWSGVLCTVLGLTQNPISEARTGTGKTAFFSLVILP